ncbi:MAG: hypothetical protein HKUEN07_14370 [Rhodocyclaceae bacterium]|uniref:DUF192 domain-containing protein n=1 Tax=Candidatus Desulfobacillus denitrificans TaxID=2608985 RepID=A0A809QY08_9PROT|nr:conserved hypothetical protein [Candidatus Desulfobacillus denitrificans]GIK44625.1 MAG: hypothetical protein BroJett012_05280 [Betaproteobacteria bacterium]GJQ54868.1 MAG: hypothetical protein HKUEN07_14370 [Rhodocyclaceae bacterium]
MKSITIFFALLLASGIALATPTIELSAGMHRIEAEVASTPADRATGLMNRPAMPTHRGMLFVFDEAGVQCFWMKNTLIPLSIAFLDDDGRIVQIADMRPQSLDNHCSVKPVRFALEMNAGWFRSRGLSAGARINGIGKAAAGR